MHYPMKLSGEYGEKLKIRVWVLVQGSNNIQGCQIQCGLGIRQGQGFQSSQLSSRGCSVTSVSLKRARGRGCCADSQNNGAPAYAKKRSITQPQTSCAIQALARLHVLPPKFIRNHGDAS